MAKYQIPLHSIYVLQDSSKNIDSHARDFGGSHFWNSLEELFELRKFERGFWVITSKLENKKEVRSSQQKNLANFDFFLQSPGWSKTDDVDVSFDFSREKG